jgi:hypothetical protein
MRRKHIVYSGGFLVALGLFFLLFGLWYIYTYGFAPESVPLRHIFIPEYSHNILWLISVSCAMIVLGNFFLLWAYKLSKEKTTF